MTQPRLILLADAPEALTEVCGISLLERQLRVAQRVGYTSALIISATPEAVRGELARRSWPREKVICEIVSRPAGPVTPAILSPHVRNEAALVVPAANYEDARLLAALSTTSAPAALLDSKPPLRVETLNASLPATNRGQFCGPILVNTALLTSLAADQPLVPQLLLAIDSGKLNVVDAAMQPTYIVSMRRNIRPLCFASPARENLKMAERLILDTAQNGTLDIPGYVHSAIENRIIARLCRTRISPNQITLAGFALGLLATWAYASGHLVAGVIIALIFGVVDGLDGKQARTKVETTEHGKWEHYLDHVLENSWWAAIAWFLWHSAQCPGAWYFFALLYASQIFDMLVRDQVKRQTSRLMDDVGPFDRYFRLIGGRRNIYTWMLAIGLLLGRFVDAYRVICVWALVTLLVHAVRALTIGRVRPAGAQSV